MTLVHKVAGDPGHLDDHNEIADHVNGTTAVHGIPDTGLLLTTSSIGSTIQSHDSTLDALAGVTTAADTLIYASGVDTFSTTTLSSFVRTLLDDVDAATARTTLGVAIGTNVQAQNANLTTLAGLSSITNLSAIAGLTTAANQITTWTGAGTAATTDYTTDWLTQYPLLAGRGASQTLIGGTSGTGVIILQGDSASTVSGGINLRSPVRVRDVGGAGETVTADPAPLLRFRQTHTVDFASSSWGGGASATVPGLLAHEQTVKFNQSTNTFASTWLSNNAIFQNVTSVVANLGQVSTFQSRPVIKADTAAITLAPSADFFSRITLSTTGGGTLTTSGSGDLVGYEASLTIADSGVTWSNTPGNGIGYTGFATISPTVTGGTLTNFTGFRVGSGSAGSGAATGLLVQALSGAGVNVGVDIAAPTGGTTNIGVRSAGSILHTGSTGIGYTVGAGGAVTQATSRTTGVTLNKICGAITLVSQVGQTTYQTFTVTNSTVAANDTIRLSQQSGTDLYLLLVTNVAAGSFKISAATTGGTTTEQPVINFTVFKGSST